jgi:rubredoxin
MKIAIRCGKCRQMWMQGEDDLQLEFDFYDLKVSFICPHCKKENVMDLKNWQNQQKVSPLPKTRFM